MIIGIPKEITQTEKRVASTPETVKKLTSLGLKVIVEKEAGLNSSILDKDYISAGAEIIDNAASLFEKADIVFKVAPPALNEKINKHEADLLKKDSILVSFLNPFINVDLVKKLANNNISSIAIDMVPRIARAQKLDALSSQGNIAGYKAVIMAANAYGRMMPLMMTAAGTVSPAKVLVIGAGVAGLQAIATAKRLGAVVEAFDTRIEVKEQVESLGGKFISLDLGGSKQDAGGYAKELSKEEHSKEEALIDTHARNSDIIITTAQIPGKTSPVLIKEETVKNMRQGSIIVDLAAEGGGNCAITEKGKEVKKYGVTIIGYLNIPSIMASQASEFYSRNVFNLFAEIFDKKEGRVMLNTEDEIIKGSLITHKGEIVHPKIKQ